MSNVLEVNGLQVEYVSDRGVVKAVDHVSFSIKKGEIFGLAGESGCGKSTTAFGICRLLRPPARLAGGSVKLSGTDITALSERAFDKLRWAQISIVLQSAMNNLNPVLRAGEQLVDVIVSHDKVTKADALDRAMKLFRLVELPADRLASYPHELSGGMRQRVVIAMALALNPQLIIMDEPTTALDVVVQAGIIRKIVELQKQFGFSILFITHDLPLMLQISDRIGIMYAGQLVEISDSKQMLQHPRHPYTQGLLASFPPLSGEKRRLAGIPGNPPDLIAAPGGCRFYNRCPHAFGPCLREEPPLRANLQGSVACHLYREEEAHERESASSE